MSFKHRRYIVLFEKNLELEPNLHPTSILTDFQKAVINDAFSAVFPNANLQGCLFHFGQSLWRRIQEDSISQLNKENKDARNICKNCQVAFVPLHCNS